MSTPTPDPTTAGSPPGSTLTAERHLPGAPFSEIRERALRDALWSRIRLREARWDFALQDIADFFATIDVTNAEVAALRDRLARAEERERDLRRWIEGELRDGPPGAHDYLHGRHFALARVLRQMDALLASPTAPSDGAARDGGCPPGGAAGDGGAGE